MQSCRSAAGAAVFLLALPLWLGGATEVYANPPVASYLFPAGGQQGTTAPVRVGGLYLYSGCHFELLGPGVTATPILHRVPTLWFEGPLLPLPESQQAEDYPHDMRGEVKIAADAPLGPRRGRLWTAEGAASGLTFIVGDLPEVVEHEIEGDPVAIPVTLPVTINGRIFPREDVDLWSFAAHKGQPVTSDVCASRLGSPLDARLEILDAHGRVLAENVGGGTDPRLRFIPPADGTYAIRIRDLGGRGGQNYVYRLTLTADVVLDRVFPLGGRRGGKVALSLYGQNVPAGPVESALPSDSPAAFTYRYGAPDRRSNSVIFDVDDIPEYLEAEPNDSPERAQPVTPPAMVNGRIERAGDVDFWGFSARKGEAFAFELRAARLGSPLHGVLAVTDAAGKVLATAETAAAGADPTLLFTAPADGTYRVRVSDCFRIRGGPAFAYRLRLGPPPPADFRLHFDTDVVTLRRGTIAKFRIGVDRIGGFTGPVTLGVRGLPSGVKVASATVPTGQAGVEIAIDTDNRAPVGAALVAITGAATVAGTSVTRTARLNGTGHPEVDSVRLTVALAPPFKIVGDYDLRLVPRGTVHRRHFRIERHGYDGPLEVRLADHQMRHLQGVTGPVLTIPPGDNEFDYPVTLPPWMETGRTSRSCVMAVGRLKVGATEYEVGFSSEAQNDQVIAVVETGRLGLECDRTSVAAGPGRSVELPVKVSRGKGVTGPVKVILALPEQVRDMTAEPLIILADQSRGVLILRFGSSPGPFTAPAIVRAILVAASGPVTAEARVEVVLDK
jgi:hypothetical protein